MLELFGKFFNDQCSPKEVKELLACVSAENESVLRAFITASLDDIDVEDKTGESRLNIVTGKIFAGIKAQINSEKGKVVQNALVSVSPTPPTAQIIP